MGKFESDSRRVGSREATAVYTALDQLADPILAKTYHLMSTMRLKYLPGHQDRQLYIPTFPCTSHPRDCLLYFNLDDILYLLSGQSDRIYAYSQDQTTE